jgi:hypothetical protein
MKIIYCVLALFVLVIIPTGMSQLESSQQIVNLMVDVTGSLHPAEEQSAVDRDNIANVYNAMIKDKIPSTWFLTQDVSSSQIVLYLTQLGLYGNIEFGVAGNHSDEKLSTLPYSEQLAILESSKRFASAARVCGKNEKNILGFKPQSFDQNQDTYKALDAIGIQYDAGFQSGILYASGHENDVWPYPVDDHNFYAVPISNYIMSGKKVALQDSYFKESGFGANQWYDALEAKFNEASTKNEPLVISLTTSISGSGDYLDAFKKFIEYAKSKNASFVNSTQLVDMAKAGVYSISAIPAITHVSTGCQTCDQNRNNQIKNDNISNETITIFVDMYNSTQSQLANNVTTT